MGYKIKQVPDDFIVEEISLVKSKQIGNYTYFILTKKNHTTENAIQMISRRFNIKRKFFGYAGNKDRRAVTTQLCSVKGNIKNINLGDMIIKIIGKGDKPISLGDLEGNKFEIIVRNIKKKPKKIDYIVNYFDSQRFGVKGNNHIIGKSIIKKDFKKAVELVDDDKLKDYLNDKPHDYIGALRLIPKKILMMYVNAYQSYLWNKCVEEYVKNKVVDFSFEMNIIGFGTEIEDDIIKRVIEDENITLRDFIIREIPELSSEGGLRKVFVKVSDLKIGELEDDELNKDKKKVKVFFSLPKGSYATIVIRKMLKKASGGNFTTF